MKEKLINRLYEFITRTDEKCSDNVLENLNDLINNKGKNGAEELLDYCIYCYDKLKENYMALHNIDEDKMTEILDEHFGDYKFMYEEIPYAVELDNIWDLCNWYLDYCDATTDDERLKYENLIEMEV